MSTTSTTTVPLAQGTWALDAAHTSVTFAIRHLGVSKVRGRFDDIAAELVVGPTPADARVEATIAMASIDTGNADRDAHILAPELLDVASRPTMTFRSTAVHAGSDGDGGGDLWTVDGDLTIGAVTRPLRLAVELGGVESFFDGTRHAGFEASGQISRKDFGLALGALGAMLGDSVRIDLDLQFVEPS